MRSRHSEAVPRRRPLAPAGVGGVARVGGKFLFRGESKYYVRGITYGPFRPDEQGSEYHDPGRAAQDLAAISAAGFNTIRTYTVPPRWLLDLAAEHALSVMVGVPWEQHVAFLDGGTALRREIEERVRDGVRACARHPAVLSIAIGNEIPASIVRWHGRRRVESFLRRLYDVAKTEDPGRLVTYVNYPTTEYLDLSFLDFLCFNVYLETHDRLAAYLARLQNLAGDRPLVLAEIGLDSVRNGELAQAHSLSWQIRTAFAAGCAGAVVFSWTDEWYRGGHEIEDWGFGLTTRERTPKPAAGAVRRALSGVPFPEGLDWPRVSVILCSYNGARTIGDCLRGVRDLDYPDFEVIVIDDGSTDATAAIARRAAASVGDRRFRVISTPNRGLARARNTGLELATGEIVAYIDDDAHPDPDWLRYLAWSFMSSSHVGVGGPNLPPPEAGLVAECVAGAPGGPIHVLVSDTEAEHIPGCNMAFRRDALVAIGGFDERFRIAGDDVDVCWRLQERGWTLGYCPAAVVWHHRRGSVRAFWRQQLQYGRAEAMLERKWPERYNGAGQAIWQGRVYGPGGGLGGSLIPPARVYHGVWGTGAFQTLQRPEGGGWRGALLSPECYLLAAITLSALAVLWRPLLLGLPLLGLTIAFAAADAGLGAVAAAPAGLTAERRRWLLRALLTAALYVIQPLARFMGRVAGSLTPWRRHGVRGVGSPIPRKLTLWSERWHPEVEWLSALESHARAAGARTRRGGPHDRWDVEVRDGELGSVRVLLAIEEHGSGRQLLRMRLRPSVAPQVVLAMSACAALAAAAFLGHAWMAGLLLGGAAALLAGATSRQWSAAAAATTEAVDALRKRPGTAVPESVYAPEPAPEERGAPG